LEVRSLKFEDQYPNSGLQVDEKRPVPPREDCKLMRRFITDILEALPGTII